MSQSIDAPDGYAETPDGHLFLADGFSAPRRWDGINSVTYQVGVTAPITAPVMAQTVGAADPAPATPVTACTIAVDLTVTPTGPIPATTPLIGNYVAYVRWADALGNFSHLSPISNTLALADPAVPLAAASTAKTAAATATTLSGTLYDQAYVDAVNFGSQLSLTELLSGTSLASQLAATTTYFNAMHAASLAATAAAAAFTAAKTARDASTANPTDATLASTAATADAAAATAQTAYASAVATGHTDYLFWVANSSFSVVAPTGSPADLAAQAAAAQGVVASLSGGAADASGAASVITGAAAVTAAATAAAVVAGGAYGLVYTGVAIPPAGVVRRQILRNVATDLDTLYIDVDTTDITSTTLRSTNYDSLLRQIGGTGISVAAANKTPGIVGAYFAFVRFLDDLGAVSNLSPVSNTLILGATDYAYGITYTNVAVPTQVNVVRRQILRNSSGQADVFYVDVDTTDLVATTFASTQFDPLLTAGTSVPIFDNDGNALANSHALPPDHKTVMAHHLGRMFTAVDKGYGRGGVVTVNGSTTVTGLNTDWRSALAGRFLWVRGASKSYQIASVNESAQTLVLTAAYTDASNPYADYGIRPAPAERRLVYYSQAGEPQSWPLTNAVSVQEDGDELTGLMVKSSFLYLIESRHIYRYTFQSNPAKDGFVFLSSNRGCVNNRCWVIAEGTAYMLDRSGIHAFDGGDSEPISDPIQHLWRSESAGPQINWLAADRFFCVHSQDEQYIRWFVCLAGERYPRHAIVLSYREKRYWIEEFDRPYSAACEGTFDSRRRAFLGGEADKVYIGWHSTLDGIDPSAGTTRGTVASSSARRLTDPVGGPLWPASIVGQSVVIVSGTGVGQRRRITAASAGVLTLLSDWDVKPDTTSVYQIGGIAWVWQSGWMRFVKEESDNGRRVEVVFDPTADGSTMTMRLYRDYAAEALLWRTSRKSKENEGFQTVAGGDALVAPMSVPHGFAQVRMDGHKEMNLEGTRFVSVELSGVSEVSEQVIFQVVVDGVQG
jgi:hypothetical protein